MTPKYSIILPTKNRPELLDGAIGSVLNQDFKDWELLVVNNDDNYKILNSLRLDPRITYLRTGHLPMYANWEYAIGHAKGEYVFILEDKMRLVPYALSIVDQVTSYNLPITFPIQFTKESALSVVKVEAENRSVVWSSELITSFCNFEQWFFNIAPRGLNTFVNRELLNHIRLHSPTGYAFSYTNPDYSFCFQLLSMVDSVLLINKPLVYVPNNWMSSGKYSNGQSNYHKKSPTVEYFRSLPVSKEDIQKVCPIPFEYLWINSVIWDFKKFCLHAEKKSLSIVEYCSFCLYLCLYGWRLKANMFVEFLMIVEYILKHRITLKVIRSFIRRLINK